MHYTTGEAMELAEALTRELKDSPHRLLIAPPFTALSAVQGVVRGSNIMLGAQNMAQAESGAHTGEVSVGMLKDLGIEAVILGHSERRHVYGETNELVSKKVKLALQHGLEVIVCVGETLEEREGGRAEAVTEEQLFGSLAGVSEQELARVTVAYEPVWAIGTGKTATPEDADAMHAFIRKRIGEEYGAAAAEALIIQYGGSVKPDNVKELMAKENIDGALVGGASLKTETFLPIAQYEKA